MRLRSLLAIHGVSLLLAGSAAAAPPSNGYIGVFGDNLGTNCCITLNASGNGWLYVYAVTGGASAAGLTGAEFRVSVEPVLAAAEFTWTPGAGVTVSSGNAVDNGAGGGIALTFQNCQTQTGLAGDKILLGSLHAKKLTGEHQLVVRSHDTPGDPGFACPSLVLCDGPTFTRVCLTLQVGDPALQGGEPAAFTSAVNSATCSGVSCGFVKIQGSTWSTIKSLYQ